MDLARYVVEAVVLEGRSYREVAPDVIPNLLDPEAAGGVDEA
jgi:hypothetical protein